MFEAFSRGYYLGRLYVEPHDGDRTLLQTDAHERVNRQLYAGADLAPLDAPLVMKLDAVHLAVHADEGVPDRTLAVPEHVLESATVENPPALTEVLLAKADRAVQLYRLFGDAFFAGATDAGT